MPPAPLSPEDFADYVVEIGSTLLAYGCPSYRLENVIRLVANHEGYEAQAFALPTGLFVSLSGKEMTSPLLRMLRVKDWGVNLERLAVVDAIFNDVVNRVITIAEARQRLRALERQPPLYSDPLRFCAMALVSGAMAVFFRGRLVDIVLAALTGLIVGLFGQALGRNASGRLLGDFFGSLVAAALAGLFSRLLPDLSREVIVLSGIIGLIPGMTLTTGLAELAYKNLVSGSARLMEAFVGFLLILFGIAMAIGAEQILGGKPSAAPFRAGLGWPVQAGALVAASFGASVIFSMPRSLLWASVLSSLVSWVITTLGTRFFPGHVVAFAAALVLGLFANVCARTTKRPAQLFQLPGLLLLVPGSFGFLSLEAFLRGEFLGGATKGFQMILTAGALVTGTLLSNVLLPAKKIL